MQGRCLVINVLMQGGNLRHSVTAKFNQITESTGKVLVPFMHVDITLQQTYYRKRDESKNERYAGNSYSQKSFFVIGYVEFLLMKLRY